MGFRDVFIGLGSNLGNPQRQLSLALDSLDAIRDIKLTNISRFYRNPPLGQLDQPYYVNAVAQIETSLDVEALFFLMQKIEVKQGRPINRKKWSSRLIDLDLLVYGEETINSETLKIPHPGIKCRAFVLLPLAEIAPSLIVPGLGRVRDLLQGIDGSSLIQL